MKSSRGDCSFWQLRWKPRTASMLIGQFFQPLIQSPEVQLCEDVSYSLASLHHSERANRNNLSLC